MSSGLFHSPMQVKQRNGTASNGVKTAEKLLLCAESKSKAHNMFICIRKGTASNAGNITMPLYKSAAQAQMRGKVMMQKRQEVLNQYFCSACAKKAG